MYPFRWPLPTSTSNHQRSAAVAKRRLHDTLPVDRARATAGDDPEALLHNLLEQEPCPKERRSA